jgi:hypothetical protein
MTCLAFQIARCECRSSIMVGQLCGHFGAPLRRSRSFNPQLPGRPRLKARSAANRRNVEMQPQTTQYETLRPTTVKTTRQPSSRTIRRHAKAARETPVAKPTTRKEPIANTWPKATREDNPILVVSIPSTKPEMVLFEEDSGLVLAIIRIPARGVNVLNLVLEAFA